MPFNDKKESMIQQWETFLRFPSIATDPNYHQEVRECANWLADQLKARGLTVELWEGSGAPALFASYMGAGPDKETLLIYGHYDVQPVDPLNEWTTPPFEPTWREGKLYARGASDDKGQIFYTICAVGDFLEHHGSLPINVKFLIEGEEESGSTSLHELLKTKSNELKSDHLIVVDSGLESADQPTVTLGARGIVTMNITIQEGNTDLHSGQCGGLAYNPNRALVKLLGTLHDSTNTVAIRGFYDEVITPLDSELAQLNLKFDETHFQQCYGFKPTGMEHGVDHRQANWLRPTLEINGISGGYAGPGFKTVIPARASANISCRLVPMQTPDRIAALVVDYLKSNAPKGLHTQIKVLPGSGPGFRCSGKSRIAKLTTQSYADVYGKNCENILIGGSVPVVPSLIAASGAEAVLIGTALPTDRLHAPDEHFALDSFEKGYQTIYRLLELFKNPNEC